MKVSKILGAVALSFLCCFVPGCDDNSVSNGLIVDDDSSSNDYLAKCTPIAKGYSFSLDSKYDGLTLYKTDVANEYYIPYFFSGTQGELAFFWDKETNELTLEESYSGLFNDDCPVYVLSQYEYRDTMGEAAEKSYYNPESKRFVFNVVLETLLGTNKIVRTSTVLYFVITEAL